MSISTQSASVYTDLQGLGQLKHQLNGDSVDDLRVVAQQFEAIFIQQMLKTMRGASLADGLFDSNEGDFYMELFDKQMSLNLSQGKGFGLADIIVQQLSHTTNPDLNDNDVAKDSDIRQNLVDSGKLVPSILSQPKFQNDDTNAEPLLPLASLTAVDSGKNLSEKNGIEFSDPEAFIKSLWPLAQSTAKKIGVDPHVIIAQAALETGWGRYIGRDQSGQNSHNLFNIKAGTNWQGDTITLSTTEFKHGVAVKEFAAFRAYDSYEASFDDYLSLVESNPRYKQVLAQASNPEAYVSAIHKAGFATDPEYAAKITNIAYGERMSNALARLKI